MTRAKEFSTKNFPDIKIPNGEIIWRDEKASQVKKDLEYSWNKIFDPTNFIYTKISWIEYNSKLDWYIASKYIYKDDFFKFCWWN